MANGDIAIPFSCGFTLQKIHNFQPQNASVDVLMNMFIYFKFTGLKEMETVMRYVTDNLKCRINDDE